MAARQLTLPWKREAPPPESARRQSRRVRQVIRDAKPKGVFRRLWWTISRVRFRPWPLLVAIGLGALVWAFAQFYLDSPYFEIAEWSIQGTGRVGEAQVREAVEAGAPSLTLARFDSARAEEALGAIPAVLYATVVRRWPGAVDVVLVEREPAAVLLGPARAMLVDIHGVVFAEAGARDLLDADLPMLTLGDARAFQPGDTVDPEFLDAAMMYASVMAPGGPWRLSPLAEVHWRAAEGITLFLEDGVRIRAGRQPPSHALPRVESLAAKLGGLGKVESVDVRMDSHLAWTPLAPPASAPPRASSR